MHRKVRAMRLNSTILEISFIFFGKLKSIIIFRSLIVGILLKSYRHSVYIFDKNKFIQGRKRVFDKTGHNT